MHKTIKPIDVLVGEAKDGHAELVGATLRGSGIVNNLYRGRDGMETLALVSHTWGDCKDATKTPSLILLDWELPCAGGIGVLRALKSDRRYSWIPIIVMSTSYSLQQAKQCRRLGCEAYVTKWTVFLELPSFVKSIRCLAGRAAGRCQEARVSNPWLHRLETGATRIVAGSHGYCSGTVDARSLSDVAQTFRHGLEHIGKEVKDGTATP
jgi:CheY-like chemotaxis protein